MSRLHEHLNKSKKYVERRRLFIKVLKSRATRFYKPLFSPAVGPCVDSSARWSVHFRVVLRYLYCSKGLYRIIQNIFVSLLVRLSVCLSVSLSRCRAFSERCTQRWSNELLFQRFWTCSTDGHALKGSMLTDTSLGWNRTRKCRLWRCFTILNSSFLTDIMTRSRRWTERKKN